MLKNAKTLYFHFLKKKEAVFDIFNYLCRSNHDKTHIIGDVI